MRFTTLLKMLHKMLLKRRSLTACAALWLSLAGASHTHAQVPAPASGKTGARTTTTTPAKSSTKTRSLPKIATRAEFDSLARVYHDTPYALPHVIFVIDRRDKNKIYYVNSTRYRFHKDFVNGTYLSLERGREFFENNYLKDNRRFIMGTLAYQTPVRRWTFEFWEGDLIPAEQIKLANEVVNRTFFERVAYKPNSLRQEEASAKIEGLERVSQSDIAAEQEYQPLNLARGLGRIHIIEKLDEHVEIGSNEILVLNEVPISLPPVAGVIITKPSTPLSHINLLVKGWGVPNAYIKNADELFKQYNGWWVDFETMRDKYTIKRADLNQLNEYQKRLAERNDVMTPRSDLNVKRIAALGEQRARDIVAYGAKSANLGQVMRARLRGITVPEGFTIPLFYYDQFVKENGFENALYEMMNDQKFVHDPAYRRERLAAMRERMQQGKVNEQLKEEVLRRMRTQYAGKGLFVRSSSNSEDLPNFSGAGLYSTVPNVKEEAQLIEAIKTVWASLWNFEAYEARERAGVDHSKVYMAVLIQEGVNADSAGVMITTDPYDPDNRDAIYISAKRGLGIKVVEGKKIAEQIIFRPRSNSVRVLTRSAEDSLLTFDEQGGVKEIPITGERAVLSDAVVRRLSRAGALIKRLFGGKEQDIEWVFMGDRIYIVQSRPYINGS
ncbi:MAG TPA: PEP/pyruvate-binding domain-containing protein [Pyrinomonadaceae bacterium]|nr:PEP/pyruvate-binding domain-containing protein [Pyrinomonadaceae bacterium]